MATRVLVPCAFLTFLGAVAPVEGQSHDFLVADLRRDSLTLVLPKASYVLVAEIRPNSIPRLLYPLAEGEWQPLPSGTVAMRLSPSNGSRWRDQAQPACLVGPSRITLESTSNDKPVSARRAACGPLPTIAIRGEGTGPWQEWSDQIYDVGVTGSGYLAIVVFDGETAVTGPNAAATRLRTGQVPVDVVRRFGLLSSRSSDPNSWQGAILKLQ